jgi:DDE superfamily endonuclease
MLFLNLSIKSFQKIINISIDNALIIMDNHYSHVSESLDSLLLELRMRRILLYPNSTHLTCVLDVSINHPFKQYLKNQYNSKLTDYILKQLKTVPAEKLSVTFPTSCLKKICS